MTKHPFTAVLLVNLGTPDFCHSNSVYRYLIEFLLDKRVMDLPWLKRQLLVRGIIVPSRYKQSAKSYEAIWTKEGSPLLVHSQNMCKDLQQILGENFHVELAMRYQNPSIEKALNNIFKKPIDHLVILPLFPQQASATTGSVYQKIMELIKDRYTFPKISFINSFADHPLYIEAICENAKKQDLTKYDHFIFSFHGLPQRHLIKANKDNYCLKTNNCCLSSCSKNKNCYSAECHETAFKIIESLQLPKDKTSITFQSRLGKDPWLQPFTLSEIEKLAKADKKNILVFSPSFVSDCLETIYEISVEYQEEFKKLGGERLDLVEGLNNSPTWIQALKDLVT